MKSKKIKIKKWALRFAALVLMLLTFLIGIVLNPVLSYAGKTEFGSITVYHESELPAGIFETIDKTTEIVKHSELYDPDFKLQMCLDDGSFYPSIFKNLQGAAFARGFYNKVVLMAPTDFTKNTIELNGYAWNLTQLIAHEMVHCFQYRARGFWKSKPIANIDDWKWEGYAEYVARLETYQKDLKRNITRFIEQDKPSNNDWIRFEDSTGTVSSYYKFWLMTQYCVDVKGMNFTEIIDASINEQDLWKQMMDWFEKN